MQKDEKGDVLTRLVEEGKISKRSKAYDIALKVISKGRASLDPLQDALYGIYIIPLIQAEATKAPIEGEPAKFNPKQLGNADAYMARSEGVKSHAMLFLAQRVFDDPGVMKPEEMRRLAAAVMAYHKYGK